MSVFPVEAVDGATSAMRRRAAEFYYKPTGINGWVLDWIEGRNPDAENVDEDVRDLANLLAEVRAKAWRQGFNMATTGRRR